MNNFFILMYLMEYFLNLNLNTENKLLNIFKLYFYNNELLILNKLCFLIWIDKIKKMNIKYKINEMFLYFKYYYIYNNINFFNKSKFKIIINNFKFRFNFVENYNLWIFFEKFWIEKNILYNFSFKKLNYYFLNEKYNYNILLEIIWTIIPCIILIIIAIPTFLFIYFADMLMEYPLLSIRVIGKQWYWIYQYQLLLLKMFKELEIKDDFLKNLNFLFLESYLIDEESLIFGEFRLLETNKRLILPIKTNIRILVTSLDVVHSWTIPSFGIKIDAVPGRLNQVALYIKRLGIFFGQCSELCGVLHGFMPIVVEVVDLEVFINWYIFFIFLLYVEQDSNFFLLYFYNKLINSFFN